MNRRLVQSAAMCLALTALTACGGSDDDNAVGSDPGTTPAPGSTTTAPGTTPAPGSSPATPVSPPGAAPAPGAPPTAGPAPAAPPAGSTIPSVASLPAGQQSGGTTAKTPSGYADQLLTGRWSFGSDDSLNNCLDFPIAVCPGTAFSASARLGYLANGNFATQIEEVSFFRGSGCQASGLAATARLASDITFDAADTAIADQFPNEASGQIAVRRGVLGNDRVEISEGAASAIAGLFASCPDLNPIDDDSTPEPTPETCTETVQLRIEASAAGPVLLLDEDGSICQPGTVAPAPRFNDMWNLIQEQGYIKLP